MRGISAWSRMIWLDPSIFSVWGCCLELVWIGQWEQDISRHFLIFAALYSAWPGERIKQSSVE